MPLLLLPLPLLLLLLINTCSLSLGALPPPPTESEAHWRQLAKDEIRAAEAMYSRMRRYRAKNVILFIGDGMGVTTVTAGRILKGQLAGTAGEEAKLSFEDFPHTGMAKTYNTDMQTPDSAATATAYLCGVKSRFGTLGVNQLIDTRNCSTYRSSSMDVSSFLEDSAAEGKAVGIVTTTRVTHATPAAAYAKTPHRDWEDDTDRNKFVLEAERARCPDIASQLVTSSDKFSVVFGGGRAKFLPRSRGGSRSDNKDLISEWKQRSATKRHKFLQTRQELQQLQPESVDTVLGLFANSHLRYDADRSADANSQEPSIEEMTLKAIDLLAPRQSGFTLLVEGGRIDHGHHENSAQRALRDLVAFDAAINATLRRVNLDETLVIVTADHSHVFSIGGWAQRGHPMFAKVRYSISGDYNARGEALGDDGLPYTSLAYADGPHAPVNRSRDDITNVDTQHLDYRQSSIVPLPYESHGAEDVPIYAVGPGSHLFHTTHEQSYVAAVVRRAICVGDFKADGDCLPEIDNSAATVRGRRLLLLLMLLLLPMLRRIAE